jgi:hypothetical protein
VSRPYSDGMKSLTLDEDAAVIRRGVRWMSEPVKMQMAVS